MARHEKGIDAYNAVLAKMKARNASALVAYRMLSEAMEKELEKALSGPYSKKQTRGAFARGATPAERTPTGRRRTLTKRQMKNRELKATIPANPVNVQSGRLRKGVRLNKGNLGVQSYRLVIEGVPYAEYIVANGGTEKMVSRQVRATLRKKFGPLSKAFVDHVRSLHTT